MNFTLHKLNIYNFITFAFQISLTSHAKNDIIMKHLNHEYIFRTFLSLEQLFILWLY